MRFVRAFPVVLTLAAGVVLSGCSVEQDAPERPGRAADEPILGVTSAGGTPECADAVVSRAADRNVLELTISGLPGDVVDYEILRNDGSTVSGTTGEFGPDQREALLTTGVPNADVDTVTLSATGSVGRPGSCVISTIS